jgi:hypothetical protein
MKRILVILLFAFNSFFVLAQEGILSFGMQYKPIFSNNFIGAGESTGEVDYFSVVRAPKFGHSFGMQIRRGFTKMFSYETGINYVKRNYSVVCSDDQNSLNSEFDFGLVGYEIPNQLLIYIRLGENFYMNTATGISLNWFASDVASSSSDVKFLQRTFIKPGWLKLALIANLGFELRTEKKGIFYLGASLTNPFYNIATTQITYDENLSTPDKEILMDLRGGIFTFDLRYYFKSDPIKKKVNDKKK